jgi:hypothetical protein
MLGKPNRSARVNTKTISPENNKRALLHKNPTADPARMLPKRPKMPRVSIGTIKIETASICGFDPRIVTGPRGVVRKRWSEASGFQSYFDAVKFSDKSQPASLLGRFAHVRGMLPNTVLGAKPLARLMNVWRERAVAAPN